MGRRKTTVPRDAITADSRTMKKIRRMAIDKDIKVFLLVDHALAEFVKHPTFPEQQ